MICFLKSEGGELQMLLDEAREKNDAGVYRSGPVYEKIKEDFHQKCYLCEDNEVTSIQIEHFEPHKDDKQKKFDWKNMFFSCGHCNNIKGAQFWPLLDCTDSSHFVWESIEMRFTSFPKPLIDISLTPDCTKPVEGENTVKFLEKALAGKETTAMKTDQAAILRRKMLRVHGDFANAIRLGDWQKVGEGVADSAPFAGMLRWYLKTDFPVLFERYFGNRIAPIRNVGQVVE